ncbi:MAG TPA: ABC transporter ATP-binding protein [Planctomycetota bacterium]|nr:ABC transporter ATP-binding protein [Planctomycetota bacterium]
MSATIEIRNLTRRFGPFTAVDDISFSVRDGEVLGFLGPNGAGKSTTMKMITGFLPPTGGSVSVCGHDVQSRPREAKRVIGYLPEGAPAYPDMTPVGFLKFIAGIRGYSGAEADGRVQRAAQRAGLAGVMHQRIETLSKGFKRRVGIAQAILHDPPVLIMDEPTDGLDPNQKHEVRALIRQMAHDKVIILSTHILEEVHAVCTRAIVIAAGRLLVDGTPAELEARSPRHNAVLLTLPAAAGARAKDELTTLPGVARVETLPAPEGSLRLRVLPASGRVIADVVARHARERGWALDELTVERGSLDDVFRQITGGAAAGGRGADTMVAPGAVGVAGGAR